MKISKLLFIYLLMISFKIQAQSKKEQIIILTDRVNRLINTNLLKDSTIIQLKNHIEEIDISLDKQQKANTELQAKFNSKEEEIKKSDKDLEKLNIELSENKRLISILNNRIDSLIEIITNNKNNIENSKNDNLALKKESNINYAIADNTPKRTIKNYNGHYSEQDRVFHIDDPVPGNATYDYYENYSSERILHGKFNFISNEYTVVGFYKDGAKDGVWKITSTKPFKSFARKNATKEFITANYLNGKLNGFCEYKKIEQNTGKILLHSKANFKDNIQVGKYEFIGFTDFWEQDNNFNFKINYSTDSVGNYNGSYLVTYEIDKIKYEDKREYQNGTMNFKLYRDISSGSILFRYHDGNTYNSESFHLFPNDVSQAINFWVCCPVDRYPCENCGCRNNPLYTVTIGINIEKLELNINRK